MPNREVQAYALGLLGAILLVGANRISHTLLGVGMNAAAAAAYVVLVFHFETPRRTGGKR